MIHLQFYGAAKDAVAEAAINLEAEFHTVEDICHYLSSHYPPLAAILTRSRIIVESRLAQSSDLLPRDTDYTVEILPPFSGG